MRVAVTILLALIVTVNVGTGTAGANATAELAHSAGKLASIEKPRKRNRAPKQEERLPFELEKPKELGVPMQYEVTDAGDTVFVDVLDPAFCLPKGRKMKDGDWRRYYKLVYNFNKVYPYALVGREMMKQVDKTLEQDVTKKSERNRYISDVERELFRLFEDDIRHMTITQGFVLMRLVDRECGMSAYQIIQTYENSFAANFWQLVARLFSHNLKVRYDPSKGEDAKIEELCKIWDAGQWEAFYFSIFLEPPTRTVIKRRTLESEVRHK